MIQATTIVAVKKGEEVAVAGDGQVTFGNNTIIKNSAKKVRRLYGDKVVVGFAGAAADSLTLCEKFEGKLESYQGNLVRAAVELAKEWRTDRVLRRLEALMIAAGKDGLLMISGTGEVIEPDDGIAAVGSGGPYALSAARALMRNTELSPGKIAEEALKIASEVCIYTNDQIILEEL